MHKLTKRLALTGLIAATLAGCNSTDALTPQVNVGGDFSSPPVTQNDLDGMAAESAPPPAMQQTAFAENQSEPAPAHTLQAQAAALSGNDAASRDMAARSLAAETSGGGETASLAAASTGETIRFLPIIGAPVQAVTPLSRSLGAEARAGGLTIRSASDNTSRYILKGYFSAMKDGGKTTVVYVWDVLDGSGARLHRIQGQESVSGTAADPWAAVPASTMETIAGKTIRQYLDWRGAARG